MTFRPNRPHAEWVRRVSARPLRFCLLLPILLLIGSTLGCETMTQGTRKFFHEMQPHRLHRWNRGPGPNNSAVHMSVTDEIPTTDAESDADRILDNDTKR